MTNLGLSEILRYLATGFVILFLAYLCEPVKVGNLLAMLGATGAPIAAFVLGSLSFLVYRPTIYNFILLKILDHVNEVNVRNNLGKRFNLEKSDAELLWTILKRSKLGKNFERIDLDSSGVHLLYMTSLFSLAAVCYLLIMLCVRKEPSVELIIILMLIAVVVGLAAFLNDLRIERVESKLLETISDSDLDIVAKELGYKK